MAEMVKKNSRLFYCNYCGLVYIDKIGANECEDKHIAKGEADPM